jgi:hypothetical protein
MLSRTFKVAISKELIDDLKELTDLQYKIN